MTIRDNSTEVALDDLLTRARREGKVVRLLRDGRLVLVRGPSAAPRAWHPTSVPADWRRRQEARRA